MENGNWIRLNQGPVVYRKLSQTKVCATSRWWAGVYQSL